MKHNLSKLYAPLIFPFDIIKHDFNLNSIELGHSKINSDEIINSTLLELLKTKNILVYNAQLLNFAPTDEISTAHIDDDGITDQVNLNYVVGGEQSEVIWYECKENYNGYVIAGRTGAKPRRYSLHQLDAIYSVHSNGACLFQAGIPHAVVNKISNRLCVSIKLRGLDGNPITWDRAIEALGEFIIV